MPRSTIIWISLTIFVDIIVGVAFVGLAWALVSIFIPAEEESHRLLLETLAFFAGLLISWLTRFEIFSKTTEHQISDLESKMQEITERIKGVPILGAVWKAMQIDNPLVRQLVVNQLNNYIRVLDDAAEGRLTITSSQSHTIVNYSDFFDKLEDGAVIKATTLILPTPAFRRIILEENKKFIQQRKGKIIRIFVASENSPFLEEWKAFVNEQRNVGVSVRYLYSEDMRSIPVDDVLITDRPRMATKAEVDVGSNTYKSVTLITKSDEVMNLEETWNALFKASVEWNESGTTISDQKPKQGVWRMPWPTRS